MKKLLITAMMALGLGVLFMPTAVSYAACAPDQDPITCGVQATCTGTSCPTTDNAETKVNGLVEDIINIFSWVVGVISVIMIIFGGFKYITSGGDAGKVTSAKNTILYALVGLVIAALAQLIVLFVLGNVT